MLLISYALPSKTVSEMLYQKYTATLTRRTSHHHILNGLLRSIPKCPVSLNCVLLKDSVVCQIILDYSCERIHWSSHWTTYFGWFLLQWFKTKCCCTGFCRLPYNWDCQDSIRYWKDSTDFGQTPVSERHGFTVLYFLYFQSCLLVILENLKCDDVSHDCFFWHLAKYTYV